MADKIPVFIGAADGVEVTPPEGVLLVDEGSDLVITARATTVGALIGSITVNSVVVLQNKYSGTITLTNIIQPQFIVIRDVGPAIIGGSTNDPCCGIKNIRLSLQEDGSIVASVSGLRDDVYSVMPRVMSGAPSVPGATYVHSGLYRVTSWREDGHLLTVSAASIVNDTFEKLPTSAVFKTIPSDIYNLYTTGIIAKSMQDPLEAPDSLIYIRSSDLYGTDGWTVQEILDTLHIDAKVPAAFNYHVYQLNVTRGAPVISLLYNLLPIPGLVIERKRITVSSTAIASYYITLAKGNGNFKGTECKVLGRSDKTLEYKTTVVGMPGEPRYIEAASPPANTPEFVATYNLVNGVFSVDYTKTILVTESNTK